MNYYVYILFSERIGKYYVGYSEFPEKRLEFHYSELNKIWSKRGQPWRLEKVISFSSKTEALKAERYIKNKKSVSYISRIIQTGVIEI
jgi:putative endonuclease